MPLVVKDRVRETSTTTGTGTFTLAGAVTGYQSFSAVGNGNTTYYTIYLQGGNEWEVGIGTYTSSGTTLSRDTILASSSGGSAVNFSAGVKDVFVTYPAGRSVWYDSATNVTLNALTLSGGTQNGVLYLNASKVATSGSALTFDGTSLGVGVAVPGQVIDGSATNPRLRLTATSTGYAASQFVNSSGSSYFGRDNSAGGFFGIANGTVVYSSTNDPIGFYLGGSEQMRLTSTGLILRQSSNSANTSVSLNTTIQNALTLEADGDLLVGTTTNTNSSKLVVNGTISETVSSTQYLVASQFDIGTAANEIPLNQYLGNLAYQDAGSIAGQVGLSAGTAALPSLVSATDTDTGMWFPAANTLAWSTGGTRAVTVDSSGNLLLGGTSTTQLDGVFGQIIGSSSKTTAGIALETSAGAYLMYTDSSDALIFWDSGSNVERARITSGGTFQTSLDASIYGVTVGRGAGAVSTNTAVGASALAGNTSGAQNTTVGNQAGATTNAAYLTAVGYQAARYNTGDGNTAIGTNALLVAGGVNGTGTNNTAIGKDALYTNTTASNNTAVGYQAAYLNTTGDSNTVVGFQAMSSQTVTGAGNSVFGSTAALNITSGQNNTALGTNSMRHQTAGSNNTAVGYGSLGLQNSPTNYAFSNSTAVGSDALAFNRASSNTAVGFQAGYANTTGDTMAAFGYWALKSNTTGRNTGIGPYALATNTTGTNNNAFGDSALYLNTTGSYNTAVGYTALLYNTTASFNTAVGYEALYNSDPALTNATSLTSGNNGTVYTIISVGSTDFTAIGAASNTAGITFTKSGGTGTGTGTVKQNVDAKNTAIGYGSGSAITTGTKNTILGSYNGNQDGLDIRTSSNVIVLSDGDGNANFIVRRNSAGSYFLAGPTKSDPSGANYYSTVSADGADVQLILQRTGTGTGWAGIGASGESAFIVYGQGLTSVPFRVKQTDGTVILKDGATAATGTGITFPATQNASSNANTLDDYEEGTWEPTMGGATFTYTSQGGRYTKVGNVVTVWVQIDVASYTSATGLFSINNLPFTVVNDATVRGGASTVCCVSGITFDNYVTGEPDSNSVAMYFESNRSNNTRVDMNSSNFAAGGFRLFVTSTYQTSA